MGKRTLNRKALWDLIFFLVLTGLFFLVCLGAGWIGSKLGFGLFETPSNVGGYIESGFFITIAIIVVCIVLGSIISALINWLFPER